jgi:hypothetical protein
MNDRQILSANPSSPDFLRTDAAVSAHSEAAVKILHESFPLSLHKSKHEPARENSGETSFEEETGLKIKHVNGKLQFYLDNSRDTHVLFQTDAGKSGLSTARQALDSLIEEKTKKIESTFGITIARSGEDAIRQSTTDSACNVSLGKMIETRTATLPELIGLQAALERSQPSQQGGASTGPIKVYFLRDQMVKESDPAAHYVQADSLNNRAIYVDPEMLQDVPILASDAPNKKNSTDRYYSIQAIFTHELGHNSEYNMGWQNQAVQDRMAGAIGWKRFENPQTHSNGWLIQGKDNRYYKNDVDDCQLRPSISNRWKNGQNIRPPRIISPIPPKKWQRA